MEAFDYVVALKIFAAGFLVYGAVLFILIRFQRAFLFQNRLPIFRILEAKEFASAHFAMTTADGETLDAVWLIACGPPCAALLYLHGNATNLNDRMPRIQALSALGFPCLQSTGAALETQRERRRKQDVSWTPKRRCNGLPTGLICPKPSCWRSRLEPGWPSSLLPNTWLEHSSCRHHSRRLSMLQKPFYPYFRFAS